MPPAVPCRSRDSQQYVDSWRAALRISEEAARINARSRRYVAVSRLARACEFADRSMRMIRVVLRRAVSVSENGPSDPVLSNAIEQMADASWTLRAALLEGKDRAEAERAFGEVAGTLRPTVAMHEDIEQTTMLLLLRPLVVDLLQAAGASAAEAVENVADLEVEPETGTLRVVEDDAKPKGAAGAAATAIADTSGAMGADGPALDAAEARGPSGAPRREPPQAGADPDTDDPAPEVAVLPVVADPSRRGRGRGRGGR